MKIIDKNTDFYDFYQNIYRDSNITWDRTDSFYLTKYLVCTYALCNSHDRQHNDCILLLQVGYSYWMFFLTLVYDTDTMYTPCDYSVELISHWNNYMSDGVPIRVSFIDFPKLLHSLSFYSNNKSSNHDIVFTHVKDLCDAVNNHDYKEIYNFFTVKVSVGDGHLSENRHIPLLRDSGLTKCVNALDVYLALEEYFGYEKTKAERTESIGITNDEKVENHGFDLKTSFRNKQR